MTEIEKSNDVQLTIEQRNKLLLMLSEAFIQVRANAWRELSRNGEGKYVETIENIADAMHNIPWMLAREEVDAFYLRTCFMQIGMAEEFDAIFK